MAIRTMNWKKMTDLEEQEKYEACLKLLKEI